MINGTQQSEPPLQRLDPRVIRLWRISQAINGAFWLTGALVAAVVLAWNRVLSPPLAILLVALVFASRVFLFLWYPPKAYQHWGYRLDGMVLEIHFGIWWKTIQLLPLSRLQHVDLHAGPLERALGLATLTLHTAGTHDAVLVIPGLDAAQAARLRDELVVKGGDDGV
ncbi:PH domain-containing protein [Fontisphaera persica]|uniref:PH domain-containing protein n=1 Tax=Fontisphaera persica TaxID=2974023 RepID=UPI0024BFED76|nr:PH domain-containing protein [Fontisphaera persica]WCJ60529.1 PH domain-containing protein [Fontisphaera persica]